MQAIATYAVGLSVLFVSANGPDFLALARESGGRVRLESPVANTAIEPVQEAGTDEKEACWNPKAVIASVAVFAIAAVALIVFRREPTEVCTYDLDTNAVVCVTE